VATIRGISGVSYIDFLAPGVLVMSALLSNGWSGTLYLTDMERGVLDRFLSTPARRSSFLIGQLGYWAMLTIIQSVILVGLALLGGARFAGGMLSVFALIAGALLLGMVMACFSNTLALRSRDQNTVIAANVMLVLPLCFVSSVFLPQALMPGWIQAVARFNPVNWAVEAGRQSVVANVDWSILLTRLGGLAALALVFGLLAVRSFRAYQRAL
jgi:ABC-2 type transport system permease protein